MKLDRNINVDGRGKYAILRLCKLDDYIDPADPFAEVAEPIAKAIKTLEDAGILDWGLVGTDGEFFLIRLKDRYATASLQAYASEAGKEDPEYAREIANMIPRSGHFSPWCKKPD